MNPQQIQNQDFSRGTPMGAGPVGGGARDNQTLSMASNVTPGADNWGSSAGGGLEGLAMNVADNRPRESGVEAVRGISPGYLPDQGRQSTLPRLDENGGGNMTEPAAIYGSRGYPEDNPFLGDEERFRSAQHQGGQQRYDRSRSPYHDDQHGGRSPPPPQHQGNPTIMLGGAPLLSPGMGRGHPQAGQGAAYGQQGAQNYGGNGYDTPQDAAINRYSQRIDPAWQINDPNAVADDDDDGINYGQRSKYGTQHPDNSAFSLGASSSGTGHGAAKGALGGAAAGGLLGGLLGRSGANTPASMDGPLYGAQPGMSMNSIPGASSGGTNAESDRYARNAAFLREEKAAQVAAQKAKKRKCAWITVGVLAFIIAGVIVGGVVGTMMANKNKGAEKDSKTHGGSATEDLASNGDLGINSPEIKELMSNPDLHKVFPGMDYTPMYTQYPECLHYPASQNNVTRDIAVLSQLTNVVRLYGTDCNQTQMVLHAIDRLDLKDKMKVWMGVWQDKNTTTNARQLEQMYNVLEEYGDSYFSGVIIGNEMLFREDITVPELSKLVTNVKSNFTKLGYKALPIATSDLGDAWTQQLADAVDVLMSNIHPFFTGKPIKEAAEFTWQFWQWQNVPLKPDLSKNYIGETGWPTKGGMSCGYDTTKLTCDNGSVAGIPELNDFMEQWICPALANGTNYFWFEAFDEPWKIKFNEEGKEWEDQWGMMDVNRKLKPGVKIPDCGGKTID